MYPFICCYCCSVTRSCLNIFDPVDCSTPGFTTSWTLLKLMSIELMMPSNHLFCCSPSPPAFNLFQHLGLFQWVSQLFASGGQNVGASASASGLPMNIQGWSPSGWTSWISFQSKGLSRVFSSTTVEKHQSEEGQRKVKEGLRTSGRTALLPKPNLHRTGPGGRKKHIKRGAKGLSPSLSLSLFPMHA